MKKLILLAALMGGVSFSSMASKMPKQNKVAKPTAQVVKAKPNTCVYSTLSCGYEGWAYGADTMEIIRNILQANAALCGD